jgi:hypothetical protein
MVMLGCEHSATTVSERASGAQRRPRSLHFAIVSNAQDRVSRPLAFHIDFEKRRYLQVALLCSI